MNMENLSNLQKSALKEIGNIGAGNAASALSQMVGRKIEMSVPEISFISTDQIQETIQNKTNIGVGIYTKVYGDINGKILMYFEKKNALQLIDILMCRETGTTKAIEGMEESAIKEVGNILASSYLSAIGEFTKLKLMPSIPNILVDNLPEIVIYVSKKFQEVLENALWIETEFIDSPNRISGNFYLLPDDKALNVILKSLNL